MSGAAVGASFIYKRRDGLDVSLRLRAVVHFLDIHAALYVPEQTPECDASAVAGHGDCPASLVVGATCWPGEAYCGAGDFEPLSDATYCGFDQVLHPSPCRFRPSCCDEALKRYGFEVRVRVKDEL